MALTSGVLDPVRRGMAPPAGAFGYPVAPSEKIWRGGLVAVNASGQLQRIQTSGSVAFVGMASQDYDNSASTAAGPNIAAEKGTYRLAVSGATVSSLNQQVFASDDNTLALANALNAVFALGGSDTGTGGVSGLAAAAGAKVGVYTITILSGAATFSVTDPNGDALANGTLGTAYSAGDVSFTLSNGGAHNFIAADTATVTVSESTGAMLVGTLAGFENSNSYVRLLGS